MAPHLWLRNWNKIMRGDFRCQKSNIPGIAIGQDHAEEQENKKIKKRGGITGITQNENSREICY